MSLGAKMGLGQELGAGVILEVGNGIGERVWMGMGWGRELDGVRVKVRGAVAHGL